MRLPGEYAKMEPQDFKRQELGGMHDVMGEISLEMYKSLEKNKSAREKSRQGVKRGTAYEKRN